MNKGNNTNWNATAMTLTYEDMVRAEKQALILLQWQLLKPTVYSFLESLTSFGIVYSNE
jgi:hypothetical protein